MARTPKPIGEFDGTGSEPIGNGGGAVDPASLVAGGGNGGGTGDGGIAGDGDEFDPAIHEGRDKRNADGSYRRKRGRKAGSPASAKATSPVSVSGIEAILVSIHGMVAAATSIPELALETDEAKMMAAAVAEVARHYPMTIDPKTLAWFNLAGCAATVYGPRIYFARTRIAGEKAIKKAAPDQSNITPFPVTGIGPVPDAMN